MPLAAAVVGSAVIGAGASVYAGSQAKKAAGKAAKAQEAAAQQQLQLQREQLAKAEQVNAPFLQGGYAAFDQLLNRIGVTGAGQPQVRPQGGPAPNNAPGTYGGQRYTTGTGGGPYMPGVSPGGGPAGPDWQGYLDANPDVAENARQRAAAEGIDPLTVAQQHWQNFGQTEGRQLPNVGETPQAAPTAPEAIQADPNASPDYMNMARPEAPEAPTFTRPQDMQAPGAFRYTSQDIENDPGYRFARDEALNGVNARFAAGNRLRSGAALKALQDRAAGVAHQFDNNFFSRALQTYNTNNDNYRYGQNRQDNLFQNDRAYDTARWQDQRTYGDNRFDAERNYQTGRYDTQTNDLFRVAGIGQGAAGATTGAGASYANNASNIFQNQANSAANTAYANAQANAQTVGGLAGAAQNLFMNWGGLSSAKPLAPAASFDAGSYRTWAGGNW